MISGSESGHLKNQLYTDVALLWIPESILDVSSDPKTNFADFRYLGDTLDILEISWLHQGRSRNV